MADTDGLGGLFFYILFVYPLCSWILAPGRFKRERGITYAIGVLAAIAIAKLSFEWYDRGANYYQMMGVRRYATPLEIKRAYKKISLELHPDKNPSEDAADQFAHMKEAYDVLMDMEYRPIYDKLGPDAVKARKRLDETAILIEMLVFYVSWGVLAYLLTLGKGAATARSWIFTGLILMLIIEVAMVLNGEGSALPAWLFPWWTEHEVVWMLHSVFPAYMNGCRSLGSFLYVDVDKQTRDLLLQLKEGHQDILLVLRDIQINMQNRVVPVMGGASGAAIAAGPPAAAGGAAGSASGKPLPYRPTPTGKFRELEARLQASQASAPDIALLRGGGAAAGGGGGNNMFWVFLLMYVAFHLYSSGN